MAPTEPDQTEPSYEDTRKLAQAVGACIISWAAVELQMFLLFRLATGMHPAISDAVLSTPRSFDVRRTMLHNAMRLWLRDRPELSDWKLLSNYVRLMGGKRNEVAHASTLVIDGEWMLEPYFVLTQPKEDRISVDQVNMRTFEFDELDLCLMWFGRQLNSQHPVRQKALAKPVPDLLIRLRAEDTQRREGQRALQKKPRQ